VAVIESFRNLAVWRKAIALSEVSYAIAASLPAQERFELGSQIRRAATSVAANIAEGHNRRARRAYANHVGIALGSLAELESHVELAIRVQMIDVEQVASFFDQAAEVNRMLHALARALSPPPR
jgi:four helix bundle protein